MVVNMETAFKFPLKDKNWLIKVLIGGALIWIPIVNFLVFGYLLKVLSDAKDKKEAALPEWQNWPVLFQEGFMAFVIGLCYAVPLFVLGMLPIIGYLFRAITVFLLAPVVSIAVCLYLERKQLPAAFDFKVIIEKIKLHLADYLIIALLTGITMIVTGIGLILAIFIFPLIIIMCIWFYILIVSYRLYGELFSAAKPA